MTRRSKRICVRLAREMCDELNASARRRAQTMSEWVRQACVARLSDPVVATERMPSRQHKVDEEWVEIQLRVPLDLLERIRVAADAREQTYPDFIRRAIKAQLARDALTIP